MGAFAMGRSRLPGALLNRARHLRREMTDAERKLWSVLRDHQLDGCRFRRQAPIGPYVVDFVCHEARLVVEVDGSQHGEQRGLAHDAVRDSWLATRGYRVLRFWNNDVLSNIDGVAEALLSALRAAGEPAATEAAQESEE